MNDRPNDLLRIRPQIKKTQQFATTSADERFQNETIRPILKLQNPLLLAIFHNYIEKRKGVFYDLGVEKKLAYIENSLIKDQKIKDNSALIFQYINNFFKSVKYTLNLFRLTSYKYCIISVSDCC